MAHIHHQFRVSSETPPSSLILLTYLCVASEMLHCKVENETMLVLPGLRCPPYAPIVLREVKLGKCALAVLPCAVVPYM